MESKQRKVIDGIRYLNFKIMDEDYCIEILKVKEIMGMVEITNVPQTPDFIRGVSNLRGQIVPIIDLRLKFEMPFKEYTDRSSIIFVELYYEGRKTLMGLVVDTIHEVINIPAEKVSKVPYINARIKSDFIHGIAETPEGIKIILDIEKVLTLEEFVIIDQMNEPEENT